MQRHVTVIQVDVKQAMAITPIYNKKWRMSESNYMPTANTNCGVKIEY
jgi:hypothetical protein